MGNRRHQGGQRPQNYGGMATNGRPSTTADPYKGFPDMATPPGTAMALAPICD
jgi:hypothetical protein